MKFGIEEILSNWRKETGFNKHRSGKYGSRIMYKADRDWSNKKYILTLYTDHPGCLIGSYGKTVDRYKDIINDWVSCGKNDWDVKINFIETDGTL